MEKPDISALANQLGAVHRDACALVAGLSEENAAWSPAPNTWSVAQILDHLAVTNRIYLRTMIEPAALARSHGVMRRSVIKPGLLGRWFVRTLEPPVTRMKRVKSPKTVLPRSSPPLADAFAQFDRSHHEVVGFLRSNADLDLNSIRFPNPFLRGVRFSLATGLHVIAAHERRHLWQAWRLRRAAEDCPQ